jgi:hypothetical protein
MANIVPPEPRSYVVFGRPKTRTATRFSGAFAVLAVLTSFMRVEQAPALLLLAIAVIAACVALVMLVVERPRHFTEYRPSPLLGPIIHLIDDRLRPGS